MKNSITDHITMTGVDASTDLFMLPEDIEIGILYTATPKDRNRYPESHDIVRMMTYMQMQGRRIALHVCGKTAREELINSQLMFMTERVQRIQVNGILDAEYVRTVCRMHRSKTIIVQANEKNLRLCDVSEVNLAMLVDASGGRGVSPTEWIRPDVNNPVGFAGGLGLHNIREELPRIMEVATGDWWIDMEGKIRSDDDKFDVFKAIEVVRIAKEVWNQ
jgi:phosphoribosylanthranilate isomerase